MKKILLFIVLCVGFLTSNIYAQSVILPVNKYIYEYTGTATDTVGATGTMFTREIQLNKLDGLFYNAKVKVSDVLANAGCTVALQGKIFSTDAYSTITTYEWKGGGTDTTLIYTANANKVYYRYLKFVVTGTATRAKVNYIVLSLKK